MQEDLEYRSIALSIKAAKLTEQTLAKAMSIVLRNMKQAGQTRNQNTPKSKNGKQSIKELSKGGTLSSIEITDGNIKKFDPIARKYGIKYSLEKDKSSDPPRWMVFFQAKDVDAITAAFKEYSKKTIKSKGDKPSVRDTMRELGTKVAELFKGKIKHKRRSEPEL